MSINMNGELGKNFIWAIVGAAFGFILSYYLDTRPSLQKMQNDINIISQNTIIIKEDLKDIKNFYQKSDKDGKECIVGFNANLGPYDVSVNANNKFGLKRGDRIELTYLYAKSKVSVECFVCFVDGASASSDASLFVSKKCLELLQIPPKQWQKGLFHVNFKKIVQVTKSDQEIEEIED